MPLRQISPDSPPSLQFPERAAVCLPADTQDVRVASIAQGGLLSFPLELERSHRERNWKVITFNLIVTMIVAPVIPIIVVLGALVGSVRRLYELCDPKTRELTQQIDAMKTEVMSNQLKAMRKAARIFNRVLPQAQEGNKYGKEIEALIDLILDDVKDGKEQERVQEVRRRLRALLQSPEYKAHWKDERGDIFFLQIIALSLKIGGKSGCPLQRVGQYLQEMYGRGDAPRDPVTLDTVAQHLESIYAKIPVFHKSSWIKMIIWWCAHPEKAFEALIGEGFLCRFGYYPEEYNSYEHGNLEQMVGVFELADHRMAFFHGAGLGQDREIDCAFLEAQRKLGATHWQHSIENSEHSGEKTRLDAQSRMAMHFDSTMIFSSSQFDGPAEKGFGIDTKSPRFVDQYFMQLSALLGLTDDSAPYHAMPKVEEEDNGFTFDPSVMNYHEVIGAHQNAQMAMTSITRANPHWRPLSSRRKAKVLLISFEVFAKLKTLLNLMAAQAANGELQVELERLGTLNTSAEACKQDIDRAIVINVLTQVSIVLLHGETLTPELENFLTGMTFSRSIMVDDRAILQKRFEAIPDFLKVVGHSPCVFAQALAQYLGADAERLNFEIDGTHQR